jgi:hypothetical protein
MHRRIGYGLLLAVCMIQCASAQQTCIRGLVLDAERGGPLASANVFLAGTTMGTFSAVDGSFLITGVPPGVYCLVASLVGHEARTQQVTVRSGDSLRLVFSLPLRTLQTEEVQSIGKTPDQWRKLLKAFTREFIGSSRNAEHTRLLNPEVVNLSRDSITHFLIASTDSMVQVENTALGYRLSIVLSIFTWDIDDGGGRYLIYPRFKELVPSTPQEEEERRLARLRSYHGSFRHFLRSLVNGVLENEKFAIHRGTITALHSGAYDPVQPGDIRLSRVEGTALWRLSFDGWLRVEYHGDRNRTSYITLSGEPAVLDAEGRILNPMSIEASGDWFDDRVADMLPTTYHE